MHEIKLNQNYHGYACQFGNSEDMTKSNASELCSETEMRACLISSLAYFKKFHKYATSCGHKDCMPSPLPTPP